MLPLCKILHVILLKYNNEYTFAFIEREKHIINRISIVLNKVGVEIKASPRLVYLHKGQLISHSDYIRLARSGE